MTASSEEPHIGLVVEGPGDHGAVPVLLRRHLADRGIHADILGSPLSAKGLGNITVAGGLEKFVGIASARPGCKGVMVVIDADKQCIKEVVEDFARRLPMPRVPLVFALAERNYEDWIFASAETLGFAPELEFSRETHGAEALRRALGDEAYTKPVHQPRFTARIDIGLVRSRSRSFDRTLTRFDSLLEQVGFVEAAGGLPSEPSAAVLDPDPAESR